MHTAVLHGLSKNAKDVDAWLAKATAKGVISVKMREIIKIILFSKTNIFK